jgi:hypothetical protein
LKIRRQILLAVLLQGGGGAATLLAALWIGKSLGPGQQGQFILMKSTIEFGAALAALGMPQALYVHAQSGRLDLQTARRIGARVALLGLPVGAVIAAWTWGAAAAWLVLTLAATVALACLQPQWRALSLLGPTSWRFNLVTATPQLLLLPLAAWIVQQAGTTVDAMAVGFAGVWLLACLHAGWELRRLEAAPTPGAAAKPANMGALAQHGLATWVTASLATFCILWIQRSADTIGGASVLGLISLGLLLVQLPLTPLGYAIPLLLRWRMTANAPALRVGRYARHAALTMLLLAACVLVLGVWWPDLWMGPAYAGLHAVVACLMLGGAADAAMRLLAVDAQAEGRPLHTARAELVRTVVVVAGVLLVASDAFGAGGPPALMLAAVWAVAAYLALITLALSVPRLARVAS